MRKGDQQMFFTPIVSRASALCRARGKSGRAGRADRKRPHARRASFECLERREVLSGGIVVTAIGATTSDAAQDSFLDPTTGNIVVAGSSQDKGSNGNFAVLRYTANGALDPSFGTGGVVTTPFPCVDKPSAGGNSYAQGVAAYPGGRTWQRASPPACPSLILIRAALAWPATTPTEAWTSR